VNGQPTDNANLFVLFSVLLAAYKWLVCWLLQATANKIKSQHQLGKDAFSAKNDTQAFFAKTLSLAFIEVSCSTVQFQTHFLQVMITYWCSHVYACMIISGMIKRLC
jgi:hypothetical protein